MDRSISRGTITNNLAVSDNQQLSVLRLSTTTYHLLTDREKLFLAKKNHVLDVIFEVMLSSDPLSRDSIYESSRLSDVN